jgi:hypothetical protein
MHQKGFSMTKRPSLVITTYIFILLNALIWLVLSIIIAANAHLARPVTPGVRWILAFLSFVMAAIILVLFIFLDRGSRRAYFLSLAIFVFTAVLTIFDDVGLSDIIVLVLNIIPIVLLIINRAVFLNTRAQLSQIS